MKYEDTGIPDLWLCTPDVYTDERGYFFEAFSKKDFQQHTGLTLDLVQQNQSKSAYGTLRGLHLQKGEYSQAKLMRVLQGKVLDVVVDLRKDSPTFGQHYSVILCEENQKQLFVPRGFAHGFLVMQADTVFVYSCDNYYHKNSELSLYYNDPKIDLEWPRVEGGHILSEKDREGLSFDAIIREMYG